IAGGDNYLFYFSIEVFLLDEKILQFSELCAAHGARSTTTQNQPIFLSQEKVNPMLVHSLGFVFLPCHPTSQLFCKSLSKPSPNATSKDNFAPGVHPGEGGVIRPRAPRINIVTR